MPWKKPDETFLVNLSNAANATLGRSQGTGTIRNDDGVLIFVNEASVIEANSGTTNLIFTVYLSLASSRTVSVAYATADLTATAGSDYLSRSGTLTFLQGQQIRLSRCRLLGISLMNPMKSST